MPMTADPVLVALDRLHDAVTENMKVDREILRRVERIQAARRAGQPLGEIVPNEPRPLIVELMSDNLRRLYDAGSEFRRAEALVLHDEGLSMERIGELFGVTRQRVSHLLRQARRAAPSID